MWTAIEDREVVAINVEDHDLPASHGHQLALTHPNFIAAGDDIAAQ